MKQGLKMNSLKYKHFSPLSCKCSVQPLSWTGGDVVRQVLWKLFYSSVIHAEHCNWSAIHCAVSCCTGYYGAARRDRYYYAVKNYQKEKCFLSNKVDHISWYSEINQKCVCAKTVSSYTCTATYVPTYIHVYITYMDLYMCVYIPTYIYILESIELDAIHLEFLVCLPCLWTWKYSIDKFIKTQGVPFVT